MGIKGGSKNIKPVSKVEEPSTSNRKLNTDFHRVRGFPQITFYSILSIFQILYLKRIKILLICEICEICG